MRKKILLSMAAVGLAVQVLPAFAQTEEIIVTARKKNESLISVPVVVTAISAQGLEKAQIHDMYSLQSHVPGLVMGTQIGAISSGVSLRGVGTSATNATIDQSVSLNIDGMQLTQGLAYKSAMFDLGQVEVLKGPQALFFGKNSPGGVVSFRSADPTEKTEIILKTGYETVAQEKFGEVILSGPLSDTLKGRLAAHYSGNNGYFKNNSTGFPTGFGMKKPTSDKFADDETLMLRGTLLFNPNDNYDARLKVNYAYNFINNGGTDNQNGACPYGKTSFTGLPVFDPIEDCTLNKYVPEQNFDPAFWQGVRNNGVQFVKSKQYFGSFEQNLRFADYTLTSVTGYYKVNQASLPNGSGTSGFITLTPDNDFSDREFTQELRFSSKYAGPLNFLLGGFYQNGKQHNYVNILGNTGIPGVPLPAILQNVDHYIDIESYSGFGQLTWNVTDHLELSGGARVTHEERDHREVNHSLVSGPLGNVVRPDPHIGSTNVSPEVTVSFKPTTDLTIFGSYKQGYKSGSFNSVVYISPLTRASFGDEKVKGGELGLKSRWFERHLSINAAAYYYRYSDLQVGSNEIDPSGAINLRTLNAASAKVRGVDFDIEWAPENVEGLTMRSSINYNDASYASFPNAPCGNGQQIAEGCNQLNTGTVANPKFNAQNLTGRPLTRAPMWTITGGFDYEMPISGSDMTLNLGTSATYTGKMYTALTDEPLFRQGAYAKINFNVALRGPNNGWELAVIGNNMTDKIVSGFCSGSPRQGAVLFGGTQFGTNVRGPGGGDYPSCSPERGRELWLRVTLRPLDLLKD
jgi:iron complex outermembrane receptor protein